MKMDHFHKYINETLAQIIKHRKMFKETPLHVAANRKTAQQLIKGGANVNATTCDGETPLHFAALASRSNVVALLLACGADPTSCNDFGQTPLHKAASSTSALAALICKSLVEALEPESREPYILKCDREAATAIHMCKRGDTLKYFLELVNDPQKIVNVPDADGRTPLHLAANYLDGPDRDRRERVRDLVDELLRQGADVNVKENADMSEEQRRWFGWRKDDDFHWSLVQTGERPIGCTPLHLFAMTGHVEAVERLLDAGASRAVLSTEGLTPAEHGEKYGVCAFLKKEYEHCSTKSWMSFNADKDEERHATVLKMLSVHT